MVELFIILVVLSAIAVGIFGFYRGWFTADKTKFKNDVNDVINKM